MAGSSMTASILPPGGCAGEAAPAIARKTEVRIWQAPELAAELLRGDFHDFSYDVHTHDTACFALITSGAIRIRMRGSEFVARQGDLYAIDADEPHAGGPVDPGGWRQRTVYVRTEHLRSLLSDGDPRADHRRCAAQRAVLSGPPGIGGAGRRAAARGALPALRRAAVRAACA
ncbi:AraC family ligand binding domain-containing protein [Burkholderia gladioli]|uniref:AraC family ligand binding domain-containing protein n=1 Tax=Burkholderia gladioli TaxID=28095 RepID=UPI00163F4800|nr:AraC family ligand binding domain-containing protein [Burkholderia gladioli]